MVSNLLKTVIFNLKKTLNRQLVIKTYILIGTVKIHCRMFYKIDSCHIIYIICKIYHSLGFSILLTPNIYSIYHVDKFYCKLIFNTSMMYYQSCVSHWLFILQVDALVIQKGFRIKRALHYFPYKTFLNFIVTASNDYVLIKNQFNSRSNWFCSTRVIINKNIS